MSGDTTMISDLTYEWSEHEGLARVARPVAVCDETPLYVLGRRANPRWGEVTATRLVDLAAACGVTALVVGQAEGGALMRSAATAAALQAERCGVPMTVWLCGAWSAAAVIRCVELAALCGRAVGLVATLTPESGGNGEALAAARSGDVPVIWRLAAGSAWAEAALATVCDRAVGAGVEALALGCGEDELCMRTVEESVAGVARRLEGAVRVEWWGGGGSGMDVGCLLAACAGGARTVYGTMLGIGPGTVPLERLLVNLKLEGAYAADVRGIRVYAEAVQEACGLSVPASYPIMGAGVFRTSAGIHAAAIIKALETGDRDLADAVYCGVPSSVVDREQDIEVGPLSGLSNVRYWLTRRGVEPVDELVRAIFERAKCSDRVLYDREIDEEVRRFQACKGTQGPDAYMTGKARS